LQPSSLSFNGQHEKVISSADLLVQKESFLNAHAVRELCLGERESLFRPTPMKRFYLAVPLEYEEETLKKIVELGIVQLTRDIPFGPTEKSETIDACKEFVRMYERLNSILAGTKTEKLPVEAVEKRSDISLDQVKAFVAKAETKLDESTTAIERLKAEIENLTIVEERLEFMNANGLRIDEIGDFRYIFVKAGFLRSTQLRKLIAHISGTSVIVVTKPGMARENFLVVTGLNEDQPLTEMILKLLNFEEFVFPQDLKPDPKMAQGEVENSIESKEKEIQNIKRDLARMRGEFDSFDLWVSTNLRIEEARGLIARTKKKSLIHGWVPSDKCDLLRAEIEEIVPSEKIYLKFENPNPEDKVPVEFKSKGILGSFAVLTNLQGTPNYFEINPTPIYMVLYVLMFGMMFGDIGAGAIFVLLGFLLIRLRRGLLAFSPEALRKLGLILISCGVSAVFFGFLYGEFFLYGIIPPVFLRPLDSIGEISIVALVFGTLQITIALVLNILNRLRSHDSLGAIFSGHGVIGLTYYLAGIALAVSFIRTMNFGVFLQQGTYVFTIIALISLVLIFLSPSIISIKRHHETRVSDKLIEGFGEGLETFIVLIANSVSYIRLAAFAIAHGALGLAAVIFTPVIGSVPSYIIMNIIVFLVEGFAALIQSLRLTYYEFSTKFYVDDGVQYKPLKITSL
jgi:V/A-type H+-transporting ATPase subunit I